MQYNLRPISSITINRDDRQRRTLADIESLAASIKNIGLLQPIVINEDGTLIAGERRLTACISLGWQDIPAILLSSLSESDRTRIELEENIKRCALSWKDECAAIQRYYKLRQEADPDISQDQIADELAMSRGMLYNHLMVASELAAGNDLVQAADKMSVALNITKRAKDRKAADIFESIATDIRVGGIEEESVAATPSAAPPSPILNADFIEWASTYSGPRFSFIHCDFPYGVNADKHDQGAAKYFRGYADTPDVYWQLIATLGDNIERIAADQAHLMFWYSLDYHTETRLALEQMGWRVNPFPLIWYKSDNTGILPDPSRGPRRVYETAFMASRGDRKIIQAVGNCFPAPVTKLVHMSEKNVSMLSHFFRMFVDEDTDVLDPTCGSGHAIHAAHGKKARRLVGLEKDPEFAERAIAHFNDYLTDDGDLDL